MDSLVKFNASELLPFQYSDIHHCSCPCCQTSWSSGRFPHLVVFCAWARRLWCTHTLTGTVCYMPATLSQISKDAIRPVEWRITHYALTAIIRQGFSNQQQSICSHAASTQQALSDCLSVRYPPCVLGYRVCFSFRVTGLSSAPSLVAHWPMMAPVPAYLRDARLRRWGNCRDTAGRGPTLLKVLCAKAVTRASGGHQEDQGIKV